jgi:hypothetical protein
MHNGYVQAHASRPAIGCARLLQQLVEVREVPSIFALAAQTHRLQDFIHSSCFTQMIAFAIALLPSVAALQGYNGIFDANGRMVKNLRAHMANNRPCYSQLGNELKYPFKYAERSEYAKQPKYLYHYTTKSGARRIVDALEILPSRKENGDAYMGDGVYMTTIPEWADPQVILSNNYGAQGRKHYGHRADAAVRILFKDLLEVLEADIKYRTDSRSVFCILGRRPLQLRHGMDIELLSSV